MRELLLEAGICSDNSLEFHEFRIGNAQKASNLSEYFRMYAKTLDEALDAVDFDGGNTSRPILVFNLLPFYLSASRFDKIISGLSVQGSFFNRFQSVVILLRNIDWALISSAFKQSLEAGIWTSSVWVVDIRCFVSGYGPSGAEATSRISRKAFRFLLDTDYKSVYRSLIHETNSYIGHFDLRDSHVRTHYDLTDYIKRDNVWEFLHERVLSEIGSAPRVLVVGVGLEHAVVSRVGDQLQALLGEDLNLTFLPVFDSLPEESIPRDWARLFDLAIIVTDIVNTGKTVETWARELQRSAQGKPVKIFSIVKMLNSPQLIAGLPLTAGIEIRRTFYVPDSCLLCEIRQPKVVVNKAADFRTITPEQMTPYDFWEMIHETKALKRSDRDLQGRPLLYRVDTAGVVRGYSGWLRNIIRLRYDESFPSVRPDAICTVDEPPGEAFASLVARALRVQRVVKVARHALQRVAPSGLPPEVQSPFQAHENVLIVDDGINYGETMRRLISFCRAASVLPMGALVLDSRLDDSSHGRIAEQMGGRPLLALYSWHSISRGL